MKRLVPFLICVMSALSCNPDAFIEPFEIEFSGTEFEVPFTGGTVEIETSHGDWEIQRVKLWGDSERPLFNKQEISYVSDYKSFELTRPTPAKLRFTLYESVDSNPSELYIYLGNGYEYEVLTIKIGACSGYSFDRIKYGSPVVLSDEDASEKAWGITADNVTGDFFDWEFPVFNSMYSRTYSFPFATIKTENMPSVSRYDTLMKYVGEPFMVPIPDPFLSNGELTFSGETVVFGYESKIYAIEHDDMKTTLTLVPGINNVDMFWGYLEYEVPYTMWFKHSGEGKDLSFEGKFVSKAHNGKWKVDLW